MLVVHIAFVPEYAGFDMRLLMRVSCAIQKQVTRDLRPIWDVLGTVDAFERLEDVPVGYWPVIITMRDLGGQDGTHLDDAGTPYALVEARRGWSLTASHECLEMIVDPYGNRTVPGAPPRDDQDRAEYLVEVCDPCQDALTAYTVNDILVSDFVTPEYYEPVVNPRGRFSYSGAVDKPHDVLVGGYVSWRDVTTKRWWQRTRSEKGVEDTDLGVQDAAARGNRTLRETINALTQHHRGISRSAAEEVDELHKSTEARKHAGRARALSLRTQSRNLPAVEPPAARAAVVAARGVDTPIDVQIDAALKAIAAAQKQKKNLPDVKDVIATLSSAKAQWQKTQEEWKNRGLVAPPNLLPEDGDLARVMSAIRTPLVTPHRNLLVGRDIIGFSQYEDFDPRWVATLWNHIFRSTVPFAVATPPSVAVHPLQPKCTIAMAGDWGTGDKSSLRIADAISAIQPTYTIHLGDVYYSGTEGEETDNLLAHWPTGTIASFALNSNHEMYSGGNGYFNVALADEKFETQGEYSYFALANNDWVILGLDSAYNATGFFQNGALNDAQVDWINALAKSGTFQGPGGRKKIVVLTHHQPIETTGEKNAALWDAVVGAFGQPGPDYWYWGHVHAVAAFKPIDVGGGVSMRGRLVGHGGVPYRSDGMTDFLDWAEPSDMPAELVTEDGVTRSRNGYALLALDGPKITEELYDEYGQRRWVLGAKN